MDLLNKYRIWLSVITLLFICLSFIGYLIFDEKILVASVGLAMGLIMLVQIESHHRIQKAMQQQQRNYTQLEAMFSLFSVLKINNPLPPMGRWAILPDLANIIVSLIIERKPKLILEVGSGVSTIVASYCLKEIGEGNIISLDYKEKFAEISQKNLIKHGLQDFANVIYAPLKEVVIGDKTWLWYDPAQLKDIESIDMLIIDGPEHDIQQMARYPALPILFNYLSDNAVIVLDDGHREDENKIVSLWLKEFNVFKKEKINTEKGTIILIKSG